MHSAVSSFCPRAPPRPSPARHTPRNMERAFPWVVKNSQATVLLWAISHVFLLHLKVIGNTALLWMLPLAQRLQGLWRGATKRGGFPESHPLPQSWLPAPGLCDLELEEAGLGCSSEQPVSRLPPGGSASERAFQEHPRSGGCPRQEVLGSWVSILAPWSPPHCRTSIPG